MSETTNYQLHLTDGTDGGSERFQDWRNAMNGPTNSNMIKIDTAIGEKADKSASIITTLLATAWSGINPPFTQVLNVDGLKAAHNGYISVAHEATAEQREIAREAMLSVTGQTDGSLTIVADGEMPERDIPVLIIILG